MKSSFATSHLRISLLGESKISSPVLNLASLPGQLIQTLGDNSCPYIKKKNLYDIVADFTAKFTVIRPQNKWLLAWHGLVMFVLLYYIFEIGLIMGYGEAVWINELAVLQSVNYIFMVILILDVLLSNIKAYYSHGLLVTHPRLIVKRYLKLRFYVDVVAIISVMIPFISGSYVLNWIKILFLFKLYSVYEIDKQFIRVSQLKISYHTFYLLSRLVMLLILGSHYLGIWFYMVDYWVYQNNYYGPNTPNLCWIYNAQSYPQLVLLQPWYNQYLYTMYFSIGTMTTIAYGDITPLNPLQTLYITIALIAYTLGFAYILSQILRILMQAQASKFQHSNNLLIVSNMMKNNLIKQKTQSKVKSYFQKVWKEQIYRNRQVQTQLIQKLPHRIRNQLFTQLYQSFFISSGMYYPGCQHLVKTNFIVALANQIRQQRLVEDHMLYKEGEQYDECNLNNHIFYFIKQLKKGKLKPSIQIGVKDLVIKTITNGNFGKEGFYTGDPRDHWAKVILSVLVYQLPRGVLVNNLHLASQIQQQNIYLVSQSVYQQKCYICNRMGHSYKNCQYVTYQPKIYQLIKYYQQIVQSQINLSKQYFQPRKQKVSYNTLTIYKDIKNIKYKVKRKYQMMINNKYYRELFSTNKKNNKGKYDLDSKRRLNTDGNLRKMTTKLSPKMMPKAANQKQIQQFNLFDQSMLLPILMQKPDNKQKRVQSLLILPQPKRQLSSSSQSQSQSCDTSSSSQESVDLQNYLKQTQLYIRHLQYFENNQQQKIQYMQDIMYDTAKEYQIYYPNYNVCQIITKFNSQLVNMQRRRAQIIAFSPLRNNINQEISDRTDRSFLQNQSIAMRPQSMRHNNQIFRQL